MKCPNCRTPDLVPVKTTDGAFALDACPTCKGVWFDDGELRGALAVPGVAQQVPGHAFQAVGRACPRCSAPLFEHCFPGTQVLVDGCRQCQGVWLDGGEWPLVRDALRQTERVTCPKCNVTQTGRDICNACGVVFAKVREQEEDRLRDEAEKPTWNLESIFAGATGFRVIQRKEWFEILSPFELRNRYDASILGTRNFHGFVEEHSRSFLNVIARQFLGALRPATLLFEDEYQNTILKMHKPFRFYFHRLEVSAASGAPMGAIQRRFHLLRSNYDVVDSAGGIVMTITGPLFLLPFMSAEYTFRRRGQDVGRLAKKWKGLLQEYFTDADTFQTEVDRSLPVAEKMLLFCAALLIDFGNYEQNESSPASLVNLLD